MDLLNYRVENFYAMPAIDECIDQVRTDETGASSDKYVAHEFPPATFLNKAVKPETRAANDASSSSSPIRFRRSENRSVEAVFVPASVVKAHVYGRSRVMAITDSE